MFKSQRLNAIRLSAATVPLVVTAASLLLVGRSSGAAVVVHAFSPPTRALRRTKIAIYPGFGVPNASAPNFSSPFPSRSATSMTTATSTAASSAVMMNDPSSGAASTSLPTNPRSANLSKEEGRRSLIRREGGPLAFNTKYGALNPYAIYYGLVSILLGLPWYVALTACQLFYAVTRNKIDPQRRVVNFITQIWGVTLMKLTRATPAMENGHILRDFYKQGRPAMFVANHNSWMDIPFLGWSIGWRNYKLVSKKELGRVPILGKAIKVGGHIMVDRSNRKSQLQTLKRGIQYLKVNEEEIILFFSFVASAWL
jgi:1-acyl-sn-glycerol-3-phosphate acyltransferase